MDFDARAYILSLEINNDWEPKVKEQWRNNKRKITEELVAEYGPFNIDRKINDFVALGSLPFSIVAFHNNFLRQSRNAFVTGAYYPCLTSACALGERILNQLILHLREHYRHTAGYKRVYRKDSFDNWDLAITVLDGWRIFADGVADNFRELQNIRNRSLHFNPETDTNDRTLALEAFKKLCRVVECQFGAGAQPWYINGTRGGTYVRKDSESLPFVKEIVLPNCALVGYLHALEFKNGKWIVHDEHHYETSDITDEEFRVLINRQH